MLDISFLRLYFVVWNRRFFIIVVLFGSLGWVSDWFERRELVRVTCFKMKWKVGLGRASDCFRE